MGFRLVPKIPEMTVIGHSRSWTMHPFVRSSGDSIRHCKSYVSQDHWRLHNSIGHTYLLASVVP